MHAAEIIVLIAGAILFTVSFFMSDRGNGASGLDEEQERKLIKELLDKEVEGARFRIDEAAMEAVNENKDRMERALDRITNEKMSAVDEYSNTVLDQIHKNHDEVMFLYDMLNNKHAQVKNTAAELNQLTKSAKVAAESVATAAPAVQAEPEPADEKNYEKGFGYVSPTKSAHPQDKVFGYTDNAPKVNEEKNANEPEAIFEELPAQKVDLEVIEVGQDIKPGAKKKSKADIPVRDDQTVIRIENKTEHFQAKIGVGLDQLRQQLIDAAPKATDADVIVTNARHYDALVRANEHLQRVIDGLQMQLSGDLLSEDLRLTLDTIAEITGGQITPNEVLGNIFKHFCVGK